MFRLVFWTWTDGAAAGVVETENMLPLMGVGT